MKPSLALTADCAPDMEASELPSSSNLTADLMLTAVLDALSVGMFWKDRESRILGCNQKFAEDSGAAGPDDIIGKTNFDFYPKAQADAYRADDLEVMNSGLPKLGIEEPLLLATGETAWIETNKAPLRNSAGDIIGLLATYRDVTERRKAGDERVRLALELAAARQAAAMWRQDALTGLPNRCHLQEELSQRLGSLGADPAKRLAIVAVDLDRFNAINDLHGHAAGDEMLRAVAGRLSEDARPDGLAARLGGDEFILIWPFSSDAELARRLAALVARFEGPIVLAEHQLVVSLAMGVATGPVEGADADVLMRRADMALHRAKERGGGRFVFFQPEMESLATERALLERDLRIAVKNDQIVPYFQPIVDLGSGQVACYEVLARWSHPERGLVPPGQFIQIAVDAGLIGAITLNLLRRACHETRNWPGAPRIAINIAPVQLRDATLPQTLLRLLAECGFPAARLEIEITEDALVLDFTTAKAILTSLKNLGVRVALDDFGTGYSSLQHLSELPFDTLKIDQSFVRSMSDSKNARMIVKAIVQLAKNLGLELVAEGIETEDQLLSLSVLGCEHGQGFFLGCPSPGISQAAKPGKTDNETEIGGPLVLPPPQQRAKRRLGSRELSEF
jgi:diguanylate cyclase (GGDEF)-like protein/PAS domain S-box-containing protein